MQILIQQSPCSVGARDIIALLVCVHRRHAAFWCLHCV